ncbi:leuB [Symbiodinium microadriaticum]|nr:leuB [Symbiodinium microadriaticum]
MIIPKQFLKTIKRTGLGKNLFDEMRYDDDGKEIADFVLNKDAYRKAEILVSGDNFGCGSSREHAPWALLDFGIRVVIATSFADIFYNNCFKNGILPIVLPKEDVDKLMDDAERGANAVVTVDLEAQTIKGPDGGTIEFDIDPFRKQCLIEGLDDIGQTLQKGKILIVAGDGIGPEVMDEVKRIIAWFGENDGLTFEVEEDLVGGAAIDVHGVPLADETMAKALASDCVLLGAVGGPKWDDLDFSIKPERGLLRLRSEMELFANLRPAICFEALVDASTLKPEVVAGLDIMIVRELTGGVYFGEPRGIEDLPDGQRRGVNTQVYTSSEIQRVARVAFDLASKRDGRLTSCEKANVMESGILWREEVQKIGDAEYPNIDLSHMYADNAAMQLVRNPKQFDVMVTDNLFGDILSDAAAMLTGSLGMLPSASLGAKDENGKSKAMYEPVHGSAPDIAGQGIANPIACVMSFAMALRYSFDEGAAADKLEDAVKSVLAAGFRTGDLMSDGMTKVTTAGMGDEPGQRNRPMGYKVAIVGATGAVGREMLNILAERNFPADEVIPLASSRSQGKEISFGEDKTLICKNVDNFDFKGVDIALFAVDDPISAKLAPKAAAAGAVAIDNSAFFRMHDDVPLIVPEVNEDDIDGYTQQNIIANPNCSTAQLVLALKPLHDAAKIKRVVVATYQSTSGAGQAGMDELFRQTRAVYVNDPLEPETFTKEIAFNAIPHIGGFKDDGSTSEEWKMAVETKKMVDPAIELIATCVRIPVFVGHSEAVHVEFENPITEDEAREIMANAPGLLVVDKREDAGYITPKECVGDFATFISRVRKDPTVENGIAFWCVSDNLRKGAALNAVQIAESLVARHLNKAA